MAVGSFTSLKEFIKSGSLFFKQGTHLYLSKGATLLGSENIMDFPLLMTRIEGEYCKYFGALINADGLDTFTISGKGTIDGNGTPYWKLSAYVANGILNVQTRTKCDHAYFT